MKKILKSLSAVLLAALMIVSACSCNYKDGGKGGNTNTEITKYSELGEYTGGRHIYNKAATLDKMLENGILSYILVVPDTNDSRLVLAAEDFQAVFLKATGETIDVVKENAASYSENSRYIVLGCETMQGAAGLTLSGEINANGFEIKTKGKSIFIMGKTGHGVLFGTYELLTQLVNYERFTVDIYTVDQNVESIPLYDFDISDNPDFEYRIGTFGPVYSNQTNANRMRFVLQYQDVYIAENGIPAFHNTLDFLPPTQYYSDHNDWYAQSTTSNNPAEINSTIKQLCYTAHGNQTAYAQMVETMAQRVIDTIQIDTKKSIITITHEDNISFCNCPTCIAEKNKYGGYGGINIKFVNAVADIVGDWVEVNQPGRDLLIATFAYGPTATAPAKKSTDGEWEPIDSTVVCRDNVAIFFAPYSSTYSKSFYDPVNIEIGKAIEGWKVCAGNFGAWLYQTTFSNYFLPYNSFASTRENYIAMLDMGAVWIFDQGQQDNMNLTSFNNLKVYLNSKLQWDVTLDLNTLIDRYFEACFAQSKDIMREYFDQLRVWTNHLEYELGIDIATSASSKNYPYSLIESWRKTCERAQEMIEPLKQANPQRYQEVYDNIAAESIMSRYMIINFYPGSMSENELKSFKAAFKEDCLRLNFTAHAEFLNINDMLSDY